MTVEAALGVLSLVVVFVLMLAGMALMFGRLRCTDAAIEAARLAARGNSQRAREAVRQLAPESARLRLHVQGDRITATVRASPLGGLLPQEWISGTAYAVLEPGVSAGGTG